MSTTNLPAHAPRTPVVVDAPARTRLVVSWAISRAAAHAAFSGVAAGAGEVLLHWHINAEESSIGLLDGDVELPLGTGVASTTTEGDLLHASADMGGDSFTVTLRGADVLYAATSLLARRGVPGGRYEVVRTAAVH